MSKRVIIVLDENTQNKLNALKVRYNTTNRSQVIRECVSACYYRLRGIKK